MALTLSGTAASAGIASGTARIINGPDGFGRFQLGDVLVCRTTDPAWTPLFGMAAAVVTENGGMLSHAAIVAREFGIPAVVGVRDAMTLLADGSFLMINGSWGTVACAAVVESAE